MGSDPSRWKSRRSGFTLIELLASMTILVLIVLMLTRLYSDAAAAIQTGKRNSDRNMNARAVMDFMARELSMAVFDFGNDPKEQFLGMAYFPDVTPGNFGLTGADEISFITLNKQDLTSGTTDGERRSAYQIRYFLEDMDGLTEEVPEFPEFRFALWRDTYQPQAPASGSRPPGAYDDTQLPNLQWMGTDENNRTRASRSGMLIDNVRTFEVFAYTDVDGTHLRGWNSWGTDKIRFLDIYLETMDEKDAAQAARLADVLGRTHPTVVEFVERAVKRNYRRVYLPNLRRSEDYLP